MLFKSKWNWKPFILRKKNMCFIHFSGIISVYLCERNSIKISTFAKTPLNPNRTYSTDFFSQWIWPSTEQPFKSNASTYYQTANIKFIPHKPYSKLVIQEDIAGNPLNKSLTNQQVNMLNICTLCLNLNVYRLNTKCVPYYQIKGILNPCH